MQNPKLPASLGVVLASAALAGCSHTTNNPNLPVGQAAYDVIPATTARAEEYYIRPLDVLTIRVFGEPDLSSNELMVGEAGKIEVPLIGTVNAEGRSASELSNDIEAKLGARYLVDPKVTVSIKSMAPRFASVEGEVQKPGVYEINKDATLLSTIARAESPTSTAKLNEIVVFRTQGNERLVARFNLKDIRTGVAPDPKIQDGDVVMVGYSKVKGMMETILRAAPLFNAWAVLNRTL